MDGFWKAWWVFVLSAALAIFVLGLPWMSYALLGMEDVHNENPEWMSAVAGIVFAMPVGGLLSAIAAIPFVIFRDKIVSPRAPYLRPGYLLVMAYGVLLTGIYSMTLVHLGLHAFLGFIVAYESVALLTTLFSILIGRELGVFEHASPTT